MGPVTSGAGGHPPHTHRHRHLPNTLCSLPTSLPTWSDGRSFLSLSLRRALPRYKAHSCLSFLSPVQSMVPNPHLVLCKPPHSAPCTSGGAVLGGSNICRETPPHQGVSLCWGTSKLDPTPSGLGSRRQARLWVRGAAADWGDLSSKSCCTMALVSLCLSFPRYHSEEYLKQTGASVGLAAGTDLSWADQRLRVPPRPSPQQLGSCPGGLCRSKALEGGRQGLSAGSQLWGSETHPTALFTAGCRSRRHNKIRFKGWVFGSPPPFY